ncbi:MAG: ATP-binding cassette domain-containing protein [Clostridia bacterium]|nr:ATP-binding cassette domain-containing protein [Clostridia bacterium]
MLKVENLVKKYGNATALAGISFTVEKGEIVGFLGPNGAGKSTTMNIITGYISSNVGKVYIDGDEILENPTAAKKKIGYLPEQPPLYMEMTVEEYLHFVYELRGCTLPRKQHLEEICEVVKITDVRSRVIRNLSKGYKQRVGIAAALIGNPPLIILDEPTVGLDPKQIIEVRNLIRMLGRDHTVILSTHILSEAQAVCDRMVIIDHGRIVADGKTEEINRFIQDNRRYKVTIAGPQNEVLAILKKLPGVVACEPLSERDGDAIAFAIEAKSGIDIRKAMFYALAEKNYPLMGLEAIGMSLEDIFIKLVDKEGA